MNARPSERQRRRRCLFPPPPSQIPSASPLTPVAWADNCPSLITQIDEILASKPDLDKETIVDEDLNKSVKQLRDEGEKLHKKGKHKESVEILEKAINLLSEETG